MMQEDIEEQPRAVEPDNATRPLAASTAIASAKDKESDEAAKKALRDFAVSLAPRARTDVGYVNKTERLLERISTSTTAEIDKLNSEENNLSAQLARFQHEQAQHTSRLRGLKFEQNVADLQEEGVEIAKDLAQLEMDANWASGEASTLKGEMGGLEKRDAAEEFVVGNQVLELQLLRQLGFMLTEDGEFLVTSGEDVNIIPSESNDTRSAFERINSAWRLATPQEDWLGE
ncbi:hypothetical protein DL93DRAFT_2074994 [Clavulina sp. PMI_390]|nr:hypothetical protein DL93DRAFT_2074994 [Clavulina sp. PMI_390]